MAPSMLDMNEDDSDIMLHVELVEGRATYALESCTRGLRYTWSEDNDGRAIQDHHCFQCVDERRE
jgi:hypothetical protein